MNKILKTKRDNIIANFIDGEQLPFQNETSDILYHLMPHQSSLKGFKSYLPPTVIKKRANVDCICIKKHTVLPSLDTILDESVKSKRGLIWIDPTSVPTECLASIISLWLEKVRPTDNVGLGIAIPNCEINYSVEKALRVWAPSSSGPVVKDLDSLKIPVWYPSLGRNFASLQSISDQFTPIEIFPIVDFPRVISYSAEKELASHHQMLDRYRTRTRNFIYLNTVCPEEGLEMLSKSFEAVSRDGKVPRSLLLTPGGTSISYIVMLIAGVLARATFITPELEVPFHDSKQLGFALIKKCE